MAVGKNKRLTKGKKGTKKKIVDPFTKKDWYTLQAPTFFTGVASQGSKGEIIMSSKGGDRKFGKTLINRTAGTKIASEELKGRVFEVSLADLNKDEDRAFRKIKLQCEDVKGDTVLTNFYGMDFTRDKLCSLIKKWQTLIEVHVDVKTTDGYTLRIFCIAFSKKRPNQVKKTCYAQSGQIRAIRKKMVETIVENATKSDLQGLVKKFLAESIGTEIEKNTQRIFPLQNVHIRKVKVLKKPKFDLVKFMELHNEDIGVSVETANKEQLVESMQGSGGRL